MVASGIRRKMTNSEQHEVNQTQRRENLLQQYALVAERRLGWDTMLNDAPNAALTALAFLLVIALGSGSSPVARCVTASVALLVSIAAISSLGRFRLCELTDAELLVELEAEISQIDSDNAVKSRAIFGPDWAKRRQAIIQREKRERHRSISLNRLSAVLGSRRAFNFWISVFVSTAMISVATIILSILAMNGIWEDFL